jgi:predicted ATP-dependent endonuclease of OLD family
MGLTSGAVPSLQDLLMSQDKIRLDKTELQNRMRKSQRRISFMQNMSELRATAAGRRTNVDEVTELPQPKEKMLRGADKGKGLERFMDDQHFKRNIERCLFGQRFILVEGRDEAKLLPYTADLLNLRHDGCTIIDCCGKYNLLYFMETLNQLDLSYVVVHDGDPLPQSPSVPSKAQIDIFNENARIAKCAQINPANLILISSPNLESVAEIKKDPKRRISIHEKFKHRAAAGVPARLKDLVEKALGAQWTIPFNHATVISI